MEVDHSLLTMTSEWERTEEIMNKTDELLKSFDAMADQHMLVHSAAFDPAQFEEAGISFASVPFRAVPTCTTAQQSARSRLNLCNADQSRLFLGSKRII
jgi:hypothetical protein